MPKIQNYDKRKDTIRRQLYGKEASEKVTVKSDSGSTYTYSGNNKTQTTSDNKKADYSYLKRDLIKILILSTLAFGIMILLYWLLNQNLINLPMINY